MSNRVKRHLYSIGEALLFAGISLWATLSAFMPAMVFHDEGVMRDVALPLAIKFAAAAAVFGYIVGYFLLFKDKR